MNINNVTDLYYLIQKTNLHSLNPAINSFVECVNEYNKICNCRSNEKSNKYRNCHNLYKSIVTNEIASLKHQIFNTITDNDVIFYFDGSVILTLIK